MGFSRAQDSTQLPKIHTVIKNSFRAHPASPRARGAGRKALGRGVDSGEGPDPHKHGSWVGQTPQGTFREGCPVSPALTGGWNVAQGADTVSQRMGCSVCAGTIPSPVQSARGCQRLLQNLSVCPGEAFWSLPSSQTWGEASVMDMQHKQLRGG